MNKNILSAEVQEFIYNNLDAEIAAIALKKSPFQEITAAELAQQLEGKKKCQKKLPTWFSTPHIYYPKKISIEQTSSEICARYKSDLISGKSVVDLTGGLGVDSYYFSKKFYTVHHCEIDPELSQIAAHNFKALGCLNIKAFSGDGIQYLNNTDQHFDWLYVDPSRRDEAKRKVFRLADCLPDCTRHMALFFERADQILIKTSPLLDISLGIKELEFVQEVHVIAIHNEVKELLWVLNKNGNTQIGIKTINFTETNADTFSFILNDEQTSFCNITKPLRYLYEPNAAILKSGAFKTVGQNLNLTKLHGHTHLYTSNELIPFPGRRFIIADILPYQKKELNKLKFQKANVATRNFPEDVAAIRKKYGLRDGGDVYLFFVTDNEGKLGVLKCKKI